MGADSQRDQRCLLRKTMDWLEPWSLLREKGGRGGREGSLVLEGERMPAGAVSGALLLGW